MFDLFKTRHICVWIRNVVVKLIFVNGFILHLYILIRLPFVCAFKCICEKRVIYKSITKYICESFAVHSLLMRLN